MRSTMRVLSMSEIAADSGRSYFSLVKEIAMLRFGAGYLSVDEYVGLRLFDKNMYAKMITTLERVPLSIFQFLFCFTIANVFWNAGLVKIQSWQPTVALFANEYCVPLLPPELAATLAATVELTCPVLLVLGLARRLATLPMLGMTFVIETFVYPDLWLIHLTWATTLLFILTKGPGAISIDHLISRAVVRQSIA